MTTADTITMADEKRFQDACRETARSNRLIFTPPVERYAISFMVGCLVDCAAVFGRRGEYVPTPIIAEGRQYVDFLMISTNPDYPTFWVTP